MIRESGAEREGRGRISTGPSVPPPRADDHRRKMYATRPVETLLTLLTVAALGLAGVCSAQDLSTGPSRPPGADSSVEGGSVGDQTITGGDSAPRLKWPPLFTLHFENDSFPGAGADDSYTQGTELYLQAPDGWPLRVPRSTLDLIFGQTIFTPHNLVTYSPSPLDRPFAAHLYFGLRSTTLWQVSRPKMPTRLTVALTAGLMGPFAFGRDAQSGWHVIRQNRLVKGWFSQSASEIQGNSRVSLEGMPVSTSWFDATAEIEAGIGTTQTFAGAGFTARVGYGLTGFPSSRIPVRVTSQPREPGPVEIGIRGGLNTRAYGRNAFLGGTFSTPSAVSPTARLTDVSVGIEARLSAWRLTYLIVQRGQEYAPVPDGVPRRHRYVALNLSREYWDTSHHGACKCLRWLANGSRLNLRFGRADSAVSPRRPVERDLSLAANLGLERAVTIKSLRFSLGYEHFGVGREEGRSRDTASHTDLFLTTRAITAGWEPSPATSAHKVQIRVGGGAASAKLQTTPDTHGLREPTSTSLVGNGYGWLVGARYSLRLRAALSLSLDLARSSQHLDDTVVTRANATSLTFGVQIHPWARDSHAVRARRVE